MSIELKGIKDTQRRLNRIAKDFSKGKRRQVGRAGATPVVRAARREVPRRRRSYQGREIPNPVKKYSRGKYLGLYYAGNLRKSLNRIKGLNKSPYVYVGPRINRNRGAGGFGQSVSNADGFYAQAWAGSRRNFRRKVLQPAAQNARAESLNKMLKKADRILDQLKRKNGFRGSI